MNTEEFKPDPKIVKRYLQTQVMKERCLYLALCPANDIPKLLGNEPVSSEDFSRISYLMERMGLQNLCCHFQMQHKKLLCAEADKILRDLEDDSADTEKEIQQLDIWEKEFLKQLPTERMKKILGELFFI